MTGFEVDFVVTDSLAAFGVYEKVFGALAVEKTALERGLNEVVFTIAGSRFHMLDENSAYGLNAPKEGQGGYIWFNLAVEDIASVFARAEQTGFTTIQPVKSVEEMGMRNSIQLDPYGYIWMLHQID